MSVPWSRHCKWPGDGPYRSCSCTCACAPKQDFEDKDYNVKKAGYWELGRLGPEVTDELMAKRERLERIKALDAEVRVRVCVCVLATWCMTREEFSPCNPLSCLIVSSRRCKG